MSDLTTIQPTDASARGVTPDHRARLLNALADVLTTQPFSHITVGDIVAKAHASKRTFYEQFTSKEACLLALCEHLSEQTLVLIAARYSTHSNWVDALESVISAFLSSFQSKPALVRALYIELHTIGPEGLAMRRRISQRFTDFLMTQVELVRRKDPGTRRLTPAMATAVVGGVNELILQAIEQGHAHRLTDLTPVATSFVHSVLIALDSHTTLSRRLLA